MPVTDRRKELEARPSSVSEDGSGWGAVGVPGCDWLEYAPDGEWTSYDTSLLLAEHERRLLALRTEVEALEERLRRDTDAYVEAIRREYLAHISSKLAELDRFSASALAELQKECVGAVLDVAEVVCRASYEGNEKLVQEHIRCQLKERNKLPLAVKIGPQSGSEEEGEGSFTLPFDLHGEASIAKVEISSELEAGDIVIEYPDGTVDFTLATVLETLRPALEQHFQSLRLAAVEELQKLATGVSDD
jgi:hypothetical protein